MISVSVVLPVYNSSSYIVRCLESMISQSFNGFELILVNDGSTDDSGRICDSYAAKHDNIRVIHQENQGVSAARQIGLDSADGEYVIFVDPDDWVEPKMLEDMLQKASQEEADVVICDFMVNSSAKAMRYEKQSPNSLETEAILRQLLMGELHGSTCNKLYCKATLKKLKISFPKSINYCEDLWFNCELLLQPDVRVAYLPKAYYHYDFYSNPAGLSRKFSIRSVNDYVSFTNFIFDSLDKSAFEKEFFELKFNVIKLAFRSNCTENEFYSFFPDQINQFKASLSSRRMHFVMKSGLRAALNGHLKIGRIMVEDYNKLYLPLASLIYKLRMARVF